MKLKKKIFCVIAVAMVAFMGIQLNPVEAAVQGVSTPRIYLPFDDFTLNDQSGHARYVYCDQGDYGYVTGRFSKAVSSHNIDNGHYTDDCRIRWNNIADTTFGNGDSYTVMFWYHPNGESDLDWLTGRHDSTRENVGYDGNGKIIVRTHDDEYLYSQKPSFGRVTNSWIHLTFTMDTSRRGRFYINGEYMGYDDLSAGKSSEFIFDCLFEPYKQTDSAWGRQEGDIDEYQIYAQKLTEIQIKQLIWNHVNELEVYYPFDDLNLNDNSGHNRHAWCDRGSYGWTSGKIGDAVNAYDYNTRIRHQYIYFNDHEAYTVMFWYHPEYSSTSHWIAGNFEYVQQNVGYHDTGKIWVRLHDKDKYLYSQTPSFGRVTDNWVHLTFTVGTDRNYNFYINGIPMGSGTVPCSSQFIFNTFTDPYYSTWGQHSGRIDEYRVYSMKLSENEINDRIWNFAPPNTVLTRVQGSLLHEADGKALQGEIYLELYQQYGENDILLDTIYTDFDGTYKFEIYLTESCDVYIVVPTFPDINCDPFEIDPGDLKYINLDTRGLYDKNNYDYHWPIAEIGEIPFTYTYYWPEENHDILITYICSSQTRITLADIETGDVGDAEFNFWTQFAINHTWERYSPWFLDECDYIQITRVESYFQVHFPDFNDKIDAIDFDTLIYGNPLRSNALKRHQDKTDNDELIELLITGGKIAEMIALATGHPELASAIRTGSSIISALQYVTSLLETDEPAVTWDITPNDNKKRLDMYIATLRDVDDGPTYFSGNQEYGGLSFTKCIKVLDLPNIEGIYYINVTHKVYFSRCYCNIFDNGIDDFGINGQNYYVMLEYENFASLLFTELIPFYYNGGSS